jgi:competence protein ComEC
MSSPASHLRAPLLWLLFPLMAGLAAARFWPPPRGGLAAPAALAALCGIGAVGLAAGESRRARLGWALAQSLAATLAGFVLLHVREPHFHEWDRRPPREVTVTLRVSQVFPPSPGTRSYSGTGEIVGAGTGETGLTGRRVYFSALRKISVPPLRSGHYLIRGVVEPLLRGPAGPGFDDYLADRGIRHKVTRARLVRELVPPGRWPQAFGRAADRLEAILRHGVGGRAEATSLYLAMLLGEKAVLSTAQQDAFMRSGTFHIFSISGLHVGVIAVALNSLLRLLRIPRRPATGLCLLILWLYVEVTGASSPALRALGMTAFLLGTQAFRRPGNPLAALAGAALVTLLLDPLQLFSTGFQMSYSVVAALIMMGGPLADRGQAAWQPFALLPPPNWRRHHHVIAWSGRKLITAGAGCWVAFLASVPSGIGYFQLFAPGSLLANLVIIPLSSLAIVSGFLSLLSGLCGLLPWSALFNAAATVTILVMDWLARHGTALPGVYFTAAFTRAWLAPASLAALTALIVAGRAGRWSRRYGGFWPPAVFVAGLLVFGVNFG